MEGLKILIDQFQESLKFENEILTQIKMAYMKLVEMLPEEERMGVKINEIIVQGIQRWVFSRKFS